MYNQIEAYKLLYRTASKEGIMPTQKLPREYTEENEHRFLSPDACFSDSGMGRMVYEPPCPLRTDFQRDRDRIIHCNAFSRLSRAARSR